MITEDAPPVILPLHPEPVAAHRVPLEVLYRAVELGADLLVTQLADGASRFELVPARPRVALLGDQVDGMHRGQA